MEQVRKRTLPVCLGEGAARRKRARAEKRHTAWGRTAVARLSKPGKSLGRATGQGSPCSHSPTKPRGGEMGFLLAVGQRPQFLIGGSLCMRLLTTWQLASPKANGSGKSKQPTMRKVSVNWK